MGMLRVWYGIVALDFLSSGTRIADNETARQRGRPSMCL